MLVRDIMSRQIRSVGLDDSLKTVRAVFEQTGFHHLLVVDERKVVGVVSDRDLLRHLSPCLGTMLERELDAATLNKRVHQIMAHKVVKGSPEMTVAEAARLMLMKRVSCLPIERADGTLVGIVTSRDVLAWVATIRAGAERNAA